MCKTIKMPSKILKEELNRGVLFPTSTNDQKHYEKDDITEQNSNSDDNRFKKEKEILNGALKDKTLPAGPSDYLKDSPGNSVIASNGNRKHCYDNELFIKKEKENEEKHCEYLREKVEANGPGFSRHNKQISSSKDDCADDTDSSTIISGSVIEEPVLDAPIVPETSYSLKCKIDNINDENLLRKCKIVPMSKMERENLMERMYMAQMKIVTEIVSKEPKYNKDTFKRLFLSHELLEQLFKLFDQSRDHQLPQEKFIEFLKQRVTSEKQIDFAEQLESVAYCLCGDDAIKLPQFIQIFNAKGIIDKLYRLIDQENSGSLTSEQIMEFIAAVTNIRPRTGFDKSSLEWLEQLFRQTVGNDKEIKREEFTKIVVSKNPFFTDRVFEIFDKDNSGSISLQEFLDAMHQFAGQSPEDKIRFLFKVYDLDGDGLIQIKELQHVIRACMEENGMQFSEEQVDELTMAMFEDADTENRGAITYEALKAQLEKHGGLLENLSISIDRWLVPPKPVNQKTSLLQKIWALRPYQLSVPYVRNNYVYLIFLLGFFVLNIALFVSRAFQYRYSNWYTIFARACGQCLNFTCMFILVLMLRQSITFLRTRGFGAFLPLDQHIYFHKLTGWLIFAYSFIHTVMHCLNFSLVVVHSPEINPKNFTVAEWLFTSRPGLFGLIGGWANPTGVLLFIILLIMFICSQAFVRRGGCFEIFYWTHLLYVPFWIFLILHGPNFWKWFAAPGVMYLAERIVRLCWMKSKRGKTYISSGILLPSKVTHLVIKRPLNFDFHPGDYVFVNIPAIAKYEWHPFTISSAPEQEDYMWLHIRGVGEWTNRLYEYFEREQERLHNGEVQPVTCSNDKRLSNGSIASNNNQNPIKKIQATITRTFSNRDPNKKVVAPQLISFRNEKINCEENPVSCSDGDLNDTASCSKDLVPYPLSPPTTEKEKRLHRIIFMGSRTLEKSLSMPDMQTKLKKKERLLALREYMRSESEKSFNECQMRRARLRSLGVAYLSPQNKSLAQSFRYMRNKPTIIAFKTPSLENCEAKDSSYSLGSISTVSPKQIPDDIRNAEEGRTCQFAETSVGSLQQKSVNYPVGKPLETISEKATPRDSQEIPERDLKKMFKRLPLGEGTEIYLDGPYGAPSSHIFRAQHAVLIATGIGVTPFASILQSIMHRYWKARHTCPKCKFSWASDIPPTVMNLRKVDFFWINRNQRSFEWFVNLLSQLEIEQAELGSAMERFLEMHMYITSALQKTDMKAVGLQLALDLLHEKEKRDLITGLKTRTNAGRPNWDKVLKQISDQKKGKVTVFYCGPPQLGRILRVKCDQFGFSFRKETF
ncbi:NADPH oxidase 5 [Agrilus planipennis]|uniref:NADPH oxidase 5 n=1 Tax=Agrilus planipennis TaxID=224129 RepID=A0A1W4X8S9_AGRPL|nr:NADPH oxidase 5 [Agrilus planipennis]